MTHVQPTISSRYECAVVAPYRLDLTVSVLRRLSTNIVDVLTPDGEYLRALAGAGGRLIVRVAQPGPERLVISIHGDDSDQAEGLVSVCRMLGVDRDLAPFEAAARGIPWLRPLAVRMRGVKPPRYSALWEACVNAILFQQVSLQSASAIIRRLVLTLSPPIQHEGVQLYAFPSSDRFQSADENLLRAAGISAGKLATLRRVADALAMGTLNEAMLAERPSPEAAAFLCGIRGIGPWTAAVILLRGLGRLDVFPANDTSVARNLALVSGSPSVDVQAVLRALSPQQGMLYYHLLLARLETRDEVGRASAPFGWGGKDWQPS